MSKKRHIIWGIAAILAAGSFYLYSNMGNIITRTAEKIASGALGVSVDIGSIDVSLSDKKVVVNSLTVGNPPGYRTPYAVAAKSIDIGLNTASQKLIDFKDITVKGSVVNLEVNEKGMNLNDLKALASKKEQKESVGSEQVRVIIEKMVIEASTIKPTIALLDGDIAPITMPAISFNNIGKGASGSNAGDVIVQIMGKYLSAVEKSAHSSGMLNGIPGYSDVRKTLDGAGEQLKKIKLF